MLTLRRAVPLAFLGLLLGTVSPPVAAADTALTTWIVTYAAPPAPAQLDVLAGLSDAVHGFTEVPAAVVVAPAGLEPLLRGLPGVEGVYANETYHYLSDAATQASGASRVWSELGWTGAGVGVAVIDAGVDGTHPDLCAAAAFCKGTPVKMVQNVKVLGRQDVAADPVVYLENQISTDSTSGHGSHVAGIAAGWGTAGVDPTRYRGVAYGAQLVGYGTGEVVEAVNVLAAFDHALAHRDAYNIKVINNSWGPGAFTAYDPEHPVNRAIDAAWNDGVSVVFGAGNDGTRTDSLNMFSANPHAISVGGGRKDHQQAFFSSKGVPGHPQLHPTVTAPGELITSVRATTGFTIVAADAGNVGGADPDTATGADIAYYASSSGTSMASPHVAGVIALMQQASKARRGRWMTPQEVRNVLQNTASPMPGYQHYSVGAGYVDALAATQAAATGTKAYAYDDRTTYDVVPFAGTVGPAAGIPTDSFASTFDVLPGATSLDVMVDWGPEKVLPANSDVDIDLVRPDGTAFDGTFLKCDPTQQPNGYSSFCSSAPNERLSVVAPAPGRWTVSVHGGLAEASDAVRGLWSAAYPDGTLLPVRPGVASVTLAASQPVSVTGQPVDLTATVRDPAGLPLPDVAVAWAGAGVGTVGHRTTVTNSFGRVTAQALSGAPGSQTVTVTAKGRTSSVPLTWLGVELPPVCTPGCLPPVLDSPGKVSGGGWWHAGSKRGLAVTAEHAALSTSTSGSLTYSDRSAFSLRSTAVQHLTISGSTATVRGTATVNGADGYSFVLTVTDQATGDQVHLVVSSAGTTVRDETATLQYGDITIAPG